jgi:hypothetical protein
MSRYLLTLFEERMNMVTARPNYFTAAAVFSDNATRLKATFSALRLWNRVLTERERQQLGGDLEALYRKHGAAGIWVKLHGVSYERAVVDVAFELNFIDGQTRRWLLRELGELSDDPEETLQAAIKTSSLVLTDRPRTVYWKGEPIEVNWARRSALWEFFWSLCQLTKAGKAMDCTDTGESSAPDAVNKIKHRLVSEPGFPSDLAALIKPIGRGTQKLHVAPSMIRLLETTSVEANRDWTP